MHLDLGAMAEPVVPPQDHTLRILPNFIKASLFSTNTPCSLANAGHGGTGGHTSGEASIVFFAWVASGFRQPGWVKGPSDLEMPLIRIQSIAMMGTYGDLFSAT